MTNPVNQSLPAPVSAESLSVDPLAPIVLQQHNENGVPAKAAAESAMLTSLIQSPQPNVEMYEQLLDQYRTTGVLPAMEDAKAQGADRENNAAIDAAFDAYGDGKITQEQLESMLSTTPSLSEDDIVDLKREAMIINLSRQSAQSLEDQIILDHKMEELIRKGYSSQDAIADMLERVKSQMGPDAANMTTGMIIDALPYVTTVAFKRAFEKVFPESELGLLDLPRGEMVHKFRENFSKLSESERYAAASDLMNALISNEGEWTSQDFQTMMLLEEAMDPVTPEGDIDWNRWIGNAISALDTAAMGGVAKFLGKSIKGLLTPGSTLSTINIVDPKSAEALAAAAIKKDMSDAVGMTPAEIVETTLTPHNWKQNIEMLPPQLAEKLTAQISRATDATKDLLARTEGNTMILNQEEQRLVRNNFRSEVAEVGNSGIYGSSYTARNTDTGIEFSAQYGRVAEDGTITPFKSAEDAATQAANTFPDARGITIYRRTPQNELVKVNPKAKGKKFTARTGEYVYEIEGFKTYANTQAAANRIFLDDGDIVKSGPLAKWVFDPASRYAKWISSAFASAGDKARGLTQELTAINTPFMQLSNSKKRDVVNMLQKYADDPTNMDMTKLAQMANHDQATLEGFVAYRNTMDALYEMENRSFRNDILAQNGKYIVAGDHQNIGSQVARGKARNIADDGGDAVQVYDPIKGEMVTLSGKQLDDMYEAGSSLYRVKEPVGDLSKQSDLVIISNADQVRPLPAHVLKKIDGYVPRHYKETYFIQRVVKGTKNGRQAENFQIIRAVGDKSEANQIVRQLVAEGKLTSEQASTAIIHDRSMTPAQRATMNLDDNISLGRMFYHKRAEQRLQGLDGLARIADPVEGMIKNIESASKYVSEQELLQTMKMRWINTFGKKAGLVDGTSFPANRAEIGSSYNLVGAEKSQALDFWDHIRKTEGMMTGDKEAWRNSFMGLAEWIIGKSTRETMFGKGRAALGTIASTIADNSLNKLARTAAFWHLIALNPVRQLYVQGMQFHFLVAMDPIRAPKFMMQGTTMSTAFQVRGSAPKLYNSMKPAWAKTMGMSTKEFDEFIEQWSRTGIPHSLDSHDYVRNTISDYSKGVTGNVLERSARGMKNIVAAPARMLKKAGFNQGELYNLSTTFLLARSKYLKATGKKSLKSRKDWDTVAGNARNMALDMTHSGSFRYQDGLFSGLTQFLSIQHKAALAVMPFGRLGNQSFTTAERLRLAIGQAAINGVTGFGIYKLYKDAKESMNLQLPEEVEPYIVGGMHEVLMNSLVNSVNSGDDVHLNFAEQIAPLGGLNAEGLVELVLANKPIHESFAAMNVFNRYKDMAETAVAMQTIKPLADDTDYLDMISNFATVTSGWNQIVRSQAALRLGYHVSNTGSATVQANFASAISEGLLGIPQRSMEEFYDLQNEYGSRIQLKRELSFPGIFGDTDDVARSLYNEMNRVVTLFQDDFDPDIESLNTTALHQLHMQRMRTALQMKSQILALYDPVERDRIWQRFSELASEEREAGADGLVKKLTKMILKGDVTSGAEGLISRIRASGLYDPESPKGKQIEWNLNRVWESLTKHQMYSDEQMKRYGEEINGTN